ncbi:hypothetical protein [Pseudoclavibacter helvolus]|uniref:hypothetical protein n=1 Tax=Pseudoclavibacter helvolus TaxID=255205 RepID=UPI003C786DE4
MPGHALDPEATGTVGPGAEWMRDASGLRTQADPLRCEFAGWLGDELVGVHPDFVVTGALADALRASDLTGFELREAVITKSPEFASTAGKLPERWERLVPTGNADADADADADDADADDAARGQDFAQRDGVLLVSERALGVLNDHRVVEAQLADAADTPERARFDRQRAEARAAAREGERAARDAEAGSDAQEVARLTKLVNALDEAAATPPTMRVNSDAKRQFAGDLTLAATALGKEIEHPAALAVLRLMDGPIEINRSGAYQCAYRNADRSLIVGMKGGVVRCVEFVFHPHRNAPDARYPRMAHLIDGVAEFTREAVLERLGEPKETQPPNRNAESRDEYRIGRQRALVYWEGEDYAPRMVMVGRKG